MVIILAPTAITILLGNHKATREYSPTKQIQKEMNQEDIELQEQIIGIIAKEIPIIYEDEAFKVQAIIARSHIIAYQQGLVSNQPPSYMTHEEMKQLWGGEYIKNFSRIKKAVEDTAGCVITYENQPVQVVYHMQNAGYTQSSKDIWGLEIEYLIGVESLWDQNAPDLINEKTYKVDEIVKKLTQENSNLVLEPYALETQIQIIERTQAGYVKAIQVGNQLMSGDAFRRALNLRSSCFALQYGGGDVVFITKGMGHGVGLSQYGANEMAKEGKTHGEILSHFFPNTAIKYVKSKKDL